MCVVRSARPSRTDAELLAACALCVGAPGRLVGSGNARILASATKRVKYEFFSGCWWGRWDAGTP